MNKRFSKFAVAAVMYVGFAVYLYWPYFKHFNALRYLLLVNVCLASLGCFVLSRRWVSAFTSSFLAGAVYGFGPFVLGLAKFHPTAGLLAATIPWLFCPAAFGPKHKWRWTTVPLSALPFLAIPLFFLLSARFRLFAIPTQARLHLENLAGLLAPLVMTNKNAALFSFYHVPMAPLIVGFCMLLEARRFGIMIIFCLGIVQAFCGPFLGISPIIWLAIPVLCCSVLVGVGTQGLILAGPADRRWILAVAVVMGALSIVMLLLATKHFQIFAGLGAGCAKLFVQTAEMYILAAVAVTIIFFIARSKLRVTAVRQILLASAMAVDIFLGARFIVDKIF